MSETLKQLKKQLKQYIADQDARIQELEDKLKAREWQNAKTSNPPDGELYYLCKVGAMGGNPRLGLAVKPYQALLWISMRKAWNTYKGQEVIEWQPLPTKPKE